MSDVPKPPGGNNALFRIAGVGTSLAFGSMVASLFALQPAPGGFSFRLSTAAVISFVVAGSVAWFYWRMVARLAVDRAPAQRRKKFILFSIGLLLVGIVSFLYPLKFIPEEKRKEVFIGLALAITVLSGVGVVMWKVKKFLDADLKKSEGEDGPGE